MAAASGRGVVAAEEEFSERELEVAAILADLPSIVRAQRRRHRRLEKQQQQQLQQRPEIPTWGRRRPRKAPPALPAAEKPAAAAAEDDRSRRDGAASPDTPLAFPDDHHDAEGKAAAHDEWAQQQRGVVASLSHENAHLLKIEEFRARLETSRSTNESLSQMQQQSKHKKRHRQPSSEEEDERRPYLQARIVAAVADRPALDLNEPAEADAEDAKPEAVAAQWFHREHQQLVQQKAAMTAAARRRRREIRRAKASGSGASRTRRPG